MDECKKKRDIETSGRVCETSKPHGYTPNVACMTDKEMPGKLRVRGSDERKSWHYQMVWLKALLIFSFSWAGAGREWNLVFFLFWVFYFGLELWVAFVFRNHTQINETFPSCFKLFVMYLCW